MNDAEHILGLAEKYFKDHQPKPILPGEDYIPASGKVLDADDLRHLVQASLNLWLTTGPFAKQFEKDFAHFMQQKYSYYVAKYLEPTTKFIHRGKQGAEFFLDYDQESTGTQRLLVLLERIFKSLDEGTLIVIDEIDSSLHSKASEALVALFVSRKTNPRGAQLIATTHDTNLMRSPLLRRDQIWFTEKSTEGETELFSLSDFPTRSTDNLERAYMQGRFGATPFTGSARTMVEAD